MHGQRIIQKLHAIKLSAAVLLSFGSMMGYAPPVAAQTTCGTTTTPSTAMGQVTQTVNAPAAGTYRVWSRIKAPNTTANSYYLQVDGGCAIKVGDNAIPANTWTWVNYQNAVSTNVINVTLTAGAHTLKYTGTEADVQLDRVIMTADLACVPTGMGDNCATVGPVDTAGPITSLTAPAAGATVSGQTTVTATATDAPSGVAKVNFFLDSSTTPFKTITGAGPYTFAWDTLTVANGSHTIGVVATDTVGNTTTLPARTITVNNTSSTPRTVTAAVSPTTVAFGAPVTTTATTSDNQGVTKVEFWLDGGLKATDTTAPYSHTWNVNSNPMAHSVIARAYDASGSYVSSAPVSYTVGGGGDTAAPTVSATVSPIALNVGSNVTATATANDNVGVAKVEFFENGVIKATDTTAPFSASWTANSAGGRAVTAKAYDAAGNATVSAAVTFTAAPFAVLKGDVNGDSKVNAIDFSLLVSHDGQNYPAADFDKDGVVGAADLALLLANWTW